MARFIIIASADIYAIGYSQTADGYHVPVRWWPDLKSLDNIVFTPFKIQMEGLRMILEQILCKFKKAPRVKTP